MEEDVGVKATVTRLRRRMSIEQAEDGGSPAPSTPTKKRGGKLAAKPQLELIEENAQVSSPRKTRRRSLATDAEEKPITPSRRSTRIKSNTSIVSETLSVQATDSPRAKRAARRNSQAGSDNEAPTTPARQTRRTRKDSASSVENQDSGTLSRPLPVAEMVIEEEPETEVQKAVNKSKSSPTLAAEETSPNNARKSKRLSEKRNRTSGSFKIEHDSSVGSIQNKSLNTSTVKEKTSSETTDIPPSPLKSKEINDNLSESNSSLLQKHDTGKKNSKSSHNKSTSALISEENESKRHRTESWPTVRTSGQSESNYFSDNEISKKRKDKSNISVSSNNSPKINKSNSSMNETINSHSFLDTSSKKKKTQSESSFTKNSKNYDQATEPKENSQSFLDTSSKKKKTQSESSFTKDPKNDDQATEPLISKENSKSFLDTSSKKKKTQSESSFTKDPENDDQATKPMISNENTRSFLDTSSKKKKKLSESSFSKALKNDDQATESILKDNSISDIKTSNDSVTREMALLFQTPPSKVEATVCFEDYDSNSGDIANTNGHIDSEDQCVPVIKHDFQENLSSKEPIVVSNTEEIVFSNQVSNDKVSDDVKAVKTDINNSCEPMDVDVTIGEEILQISQLQNVITRLSDEVKSSQQTEVENQSLSLSKHATIEGETNKSKRKSSTSLTLDRSKDENKSTLILSQIKDVSCTSESHKSPKATHINGHEILSKSDVNFHDNDKKTSKNNLSLNEIKGTPKQITIQKLSIQTSTPITMHQVDMKTKKDEQNINTKKNKSNFSKSINDSDSSESDSDVAESSVEKSKFLNDEAEEASDDYESGDSQDEEERKYEEENAIVERGETLDSDDDVSNDTDYEKDSFVVSSDAEDNELLSGSGDDLSMSDNELSMSKKSKSKFNERKLKEQKKASREMFESRHKLNTSDQKSPTPKTKQNRMRIDSTVSEEDVPKPKKNNRMRLNSTLETSAQAQEDTEPSLNKSKKKNKSMEVSSLDANDKQEDANVSLNKSKENDKSMQDLTLNTTDKQEVTNKSLNKSKKRDNSICDATLDTTDKEDITSNSLKKNKKKNKSLQDSLCSKSAIDENEITLFNGSLIEKTDPLQVCVKQEPKTPQKGLDISVIFTDRQEIENVQVTENYSILNQTGTDPLQATTACEDTSDSSGNEEIMQNYDSVLNDLNNEKKTKLNNHNISLNIDKKDKKNREPIVDQLNLTHTKKIKKNIEKGNVTDSKPVIIPKKDTNSDSEDSSNSIDLQLLFSEDNSGSEDGQVNKESQPKTEDDNMFIPLKKSPGTTNIRHSIGMDISQQDTNISLNESCKKKKDRKSSLVAADKDEDISNKSGINVSLNESRKKNKHSISESARQESDNLNKSKDINISLNESKKKKKHSISESTVQESDNFNKSKDINVSLNESKKKKKHSISESTVQEPEIDNIEPALSESAKKKKKLKSSLSALDAEQLPEGNLFFIDTTGTLQDDNGDHCGDVNEPSLNVLYESKKKKKKNKLKESRNEIDEHRMTEEEKPAKTPKSDKKKNKTESLEVTEEVKPAMTPKSEKKKKKTESLVMAEEVQPASTPKSDKKKEKKVPQKIDSLECDDNSNDAPDETPYRSEKATEADLNNTESVSESAETGSGKKKKKKKKKSNPVQNQPGPSGDAKENIPSNSKKRKRKSSNADGSEVSGDIQDCVETVNLNELAGSYKKKRKISHNENNNPSGANESKHDKKKKNRDVNFQSTAPQTETTDSQVKKNKKRKHREDDGDITQTKVSKDNSFQEVHVPRLPDSILNQLDDKPRKIKGDKVISTSNFVVENARQKRAKPSNYLEESIYLDADSPKPRKEKPRFKKPKVLPFIPTASTSESGFTSHFKINKLSVATKFEAENLGFSKESYLQKKTIKKLGTYDRYKKQMHHKISKF